MSTDITSLTLRLAQLSRDLDQAQSDLQDAELDCARARHRADLAEAKAYLAAEGPVDARKRTALVATEQHALDAEVAEAGVKAARSRMATLRAQIDVGRTLLSSAKAEMQSFPGTGAA